MFLYICMYLKNKIVLYTHITWFYFLYSINLSISIYINFKAQTKLYSTLTSIYHFQQKIDSNSFTTIMKK